MAAVVCGLCSGKLIMGADGIAVCDSCSMEYTADRTGEKVQDIKGSVQTDNHHLIEKYMEMAQSARDAGNNTGAELYCSRIIEIEPTNYKAQMLKGEAIVWQSSMQNSRVDEAVAAFIEAINNAPDDVKDELAEEAKEQIKRFAVSMVLLKADHFDKWTDEEETAGFISDIASLLLNVKLFRANGELPNADNNA